MTKIILFRDRIRGNWMATHKGRTVHDDHTVITHYSSAENAGDVVKAITRANPGAEIEVNERVDQ